MYEWIWRRLPGGRLRKAAQALAMAMATVAVLFMVVFPYVEPRLPWNRSVVTTPTAPSAPPTAPITPTPGSSE